MVEIRLDSQLICTAVTPADAVLSGIRAASFCGKSIFAWIDPGEEQAIREALLEVRDGGRDAAIVARFLKRPGSRATDRIRIAARRDDGEGQLVLRVSDETRETPTALEETRVATLEGLVADLNGQLVGADGVPLDEACAASLARLAHLFDALRVRFISVECRTDATPTSICHLAGDVEPDAAPMAWGRVEDFPWCAAHLGRDPFLEIPDVSRLPADASQDRGRFEALGAASVLIVGASSLGEIVGLLVLQGRHPAAPISRDEKQLLQTIAVLFNSAIRRRRTEATLRESEERFRALAENSRDCICEIGADGRILYASPSYAELFGRRQSDLAGTNPIDVVLPEDREQVEDLVGSGSHARRPVSTVYRAMSRGAEIRYLEATARAYETPSGEPRVVLVSRDVTEREHARQALARQIELETRVAELSRFFIDLDPEAIHGGVETQLSMLAGLAAAEHSWLHAQLAEDTQIESFNSWSIDPSGRKPVPKSDSVGTFPYSTGLILSGRVYHVPDVDALPDEASAERQDMLDRNVLSILGIPIMSQGRFVGFLGFESFERKANWSDEMIQLLRVAGEIFYSALRRGQAADALRASQAQLLQAQKMEAVGTLAGGIAHDFNNHLAVMLGNARFVRQEIEAAPEVVEAIEDLERAADHCAQLTRSLLAFSRRTPVEVLPVPVAEVVEGVDGLVRPLLPSNVILSTELTPELGSFEVDRVQIQQVLVNLLVNARDAMPDGGSVGLTVERRTVTPAEIRFEEFEANRDYVVITVQDDGRGMDAETASRVFEPFYTTKQQGEGTGLGLAMAYGIVRQSRGALSVESELGVGTTFRVYLPAVDREERSKDGQGESEVEGQGQGSCQVLLVGQEPATRRLVGRTLAGAGYGIATAETLESADAALRSAARQDHLIILDAGSGTPGLGAPVEEWLSDYGELRVLLLNPSDDPSSGGMLAGRDRVHVLRQPFDEDRLVGAVGEAFGNSLGNG